MLIDNQSYLLPGQSYSQTVNVPFPYYATGTWYVYVMTNCLFTHSPLDNFIDIGPVVESNPNNNLTANAPFTVTPAPLPGLTVARCRRRPGILGAAPECLVDGYQQGSGNRHRPGLASGYAPSSPVTPTLPADSTWTDEVFMSPDPKLDSNAVRWGRSSTTALSSGASYTDSEQVTLPVGVSGNFYIIVRTDLYGQVYESGSTASESAPLPSPLQST